MSNQESNTDYKALPDFMENEKEEPAAPAPQKPKSLTWILFAVIATVCFAFSAYILGIISVSGASAKFLNSWGYLLVSLLILFTKNVKFCRERSKEKALDPEGTKDLSSVASLKDSCYYDSEKGQYKICGFLLSFICGLLNFAGEFSIIFAFQHALESLLNQGILTSLFTLGSIVVLVGSVVLLKEHVRFCEYAGVVLIILGTVFIALTKKGEESIPGVGLPSGPYEQTDIVEPEGLVPTEGPGLAIIFAIVATVCFGLRGLLLKYMGIKMQIDGVSASSIFLMTDGLVGGIVGLVITIIGGGYSSFPPLYILLGIVSGTLAGTGVLCLNIALMDGLAGPAVAMANLSSVIQALLDWGFLGQTPSLFEVLGLIVAVVGAIIMAIGDDYFIKPLFYPDSKSTNGDLNSPSGGYKKPNLQDAMLKRNQDKNQSNKDFLDKEKQSEGKDEEEGAE